MELKPIGSNMTTLTLNDGTEILFSYETPVAGYLAGDRKPFHGPKIKIAPNTAPEIVFFRTDEKFSRTTTRHINKYLNGADATVVPHNQILMMADLVG